MKHRETRTNDSPYIVYHRCNTYSRVDRRATHLFYKNQPKIHGRMDSTDIYIKINTC